MRAVILVLCFSFILIADPSKLVLLKTYKEDMNVTGWAMSEKLDGIRAVWNGKELISRNAKPLNPPVWFTRDFPPFALDGELWSFRGDFEHIVSIVNSHDSNISWRELKYHVFEVPEQEGGLLRRLEVLQAYLQEHPNKNIRIIKQVTIKDQAHAKAFFDEVVANKGEGVVIRDKTQKYYTGRTSHSLKYKPFIDDECKVVSITEGEGKFKGLMGSIRCDFKGKIIKIGSGFSDKERRFPPKVGALVSFKYYGLTGLGNPKYPVYLRVRSDEGLSVD